MNCSQCGCDTFELKSDTHDLCSYLVTINDAGEITREESLREECGDTDPHGNVICGECGLNLRIGTWEVLEPGERILPFSVLLLYPGYITGKDNETYLAHVYARDAEEALRLARDEAAEKEANRFIPKCDFAPLGIFRGHLEMDNLRVSPEDLP